MKELEAQISKSFKAMVQSGEIEKTIYERLRKTIDDILNDCLRPYSPFGKALKEHIETQLKVNFQEIGLGEYNQLVLGVLKAKLDSLLDATWKKDLEKDLEDFLRAGPSEIKLSKILEELKNDHALDAEHHEWEYATCIVEKSEYSSRWIYFSPKGQTEKYRCEYKILLGDEGHIRGVYADGKEANDNIIGKLHGFSRLLFQLRVGKSKVILDLGEGVNESFYSQED